MTTTVNPTLGFAYQPQVKDSGSVLVGIAQIRVGLPSYRPAGTAIVSPIQCVGLSVTTVDSSMGVATDIITPSDMSQGGTFNTPVGMAITTSGTYTGTYDGNFTIRVASTTAVDIYSPHGYKDAGVTVASFSSTPYPLKMDGTGTSGISIQGTLATTLTVGMTYIIPVWSGTAMSNIKTGIISPYSMFAGSTNSVGGIKQASFTPKIDSLKTLEAGFPAIVYDTAVEKTSVDIKFDAYEYNNANVANLKNIVSQAINQSVVPAVPVEVVMRTRGNSLVSFWVPNCQITQFPSIAPTNDYSTLAWELQGIRLSQITGETATYNTYLANTVMFQELTYVH